MPSSLFADLDRSTANGIENSRAIQLAIELTMMGLTDSSGSEPVSPTADLGSFTNPMLGVGLDEVRSKKSQNMTECVPVPSSEHVAEIVGRQGCKIKALRAKTNTYIKTPVRGEEPVFVVTGRKEDVGKAKREILSAADHFSQIRASRKNNLAGLGSGTSTPPGPPANIPGHVTIQVRVPYRVVGLVVGPKGATIKRIQHQTHTYIVTPSRDKEPVFEVTGLPESVETARREIEAHIAMRTGNGVSLNSINGNSGLEDLDLLASLCKNGFNSLFNSMEVNADPFPAMTSSTGAFSTSSGSCSSSSSSAGGRNDLGAIWSSKDREDCSGDSPSFDGNTALSSIWSYPCVTVSSRPSRTNSASPSSTDSLFSTGQGRCSMCNEARATQTLIPCGHNSFCTNCAMEFDEPLCSVCSMPAVPAVHIPKL